MALGKCPDCGEVVSTTAKFCPHCGWVSRKNSQTLDNTGRGFRTAGIVMFIAGIVIPTFFYIAGPAQFMGALAFGSGLVSASFMVILLDISGSLKAKRIYPEGDFQEAFGTNDHLDALRKKLGLSEDDGGQK